MALSKKRGGTGIAAHPREGKLHGRHAFSRRVNEQARPTWAAYGSRQGASAGRQQQTPRVCARLYLCCGFLTLSSRTTPTPCRGARPGPDAKRCFRYSRNTEIPCILFRLKQNAGFLQLRGGRSRPFADRPYSSHSSLTMRLPLRHCAGQGAPRLAAG